jgi:aminoacrylate hydrolase
MASLETQGISLYYEVFGTPTQLPVLLLAGLGGIGNSWGAQIDRFARRHFVVVPDHRGTGRSTHTIEGLTTVQLAADVAALVEHLAVGPMHVVGASTGGAIGQFMALNHPQTVRSLALCSSFARFDAFTRREFEVRRKLVADSDLRTIYSCYALFLFSPRYTRENPGQVAAWIERASAHSLEPTDREIALQRIDMIVGHDAFARLGDIRQPALVVCGDQDFCTPLPLSEEIARTIPGCEFVVFPGGGHKVDQEQEEQFFETVSGFIDRH